MIARTIVLFASVLSTVCLASSDEWSAYLRLIEQADPKTLQAFSEKINSIGNTLDYEHTEELTTALSTALIKNPVAVINATQSLDIVTEPLKQRFAASFICCLPGAQNEDDYAKAELALKKAGPAAAECLEIMQEVHDEMQQYPHP